MLSIEPEYITSIFTMNQISVSYITYMPYIILVIESKMKNKTGIKGDAYITEVISSGFSG